MEGQKPISKAEKRWLVREVEAGRMSKADACEVLKGRSINPLSMLKNWMKEYHSEIALTLPLMTEKEREKLEAAQRRMKELEKQLEHAQMKNIALETMIDIAEEQLKISIRKKSGLKQ